MRRKSIVRIILITALILLVPLIAMQFRDEMDWDLTDFLIMGILIASTGFLYELASSKVSKTRHRVTIAAVILVAFLLVWAELAVGII